MTKTMSIRMDRENFEFLSELTREQRSNLSEAVRDLVTRGRVLLAGKNTRRVKHPWAGPLPLLAFLSAK